MNAAGKQITKTFQRKRSGSNIFTAVAPCDFELPAGVLTVIGGRSGSGKSTLLNMLAGILKPTDGVVEYDGNDIYAMKDEELSDLRGRTVGYIPQGRSAVATLSVLENVMLPLILCGERDEKKALELMDRFDIADLKDVMPRRLSGGELRRMAIARALMRDPQILFADEPTSDLDDENTQVVFEALLKIAHDGAAVLAVTHEDEAVQYADRIFRMDAGVLSDAAGSF